MMRLMQSTTSTRRMNYRWVVATAICGSALWYWNYEASVAARQPWIGAYLVNYGKLDHEFDEFVLILDSDGTSMAWNHWGSDWSPMGDFKWRATNSQFILREPLKAPADW